MRRGASTKRRAGVGGVVALFYGGFCGVFLSVVVSCSAACFCVRINTAADRLWPALWLELDVQCLPSCIPAHIRFPTCPVQASDVPALLRAKAELETRCEMLESQIAKMQVRANAHSAACETAPCPHA